MGHWRELWVESVVPLKPYPLKYLSRFTLLPCVETSVSENISFVSLWFLVSIKFFAVYGSHHPCGPRATKQWRHIPVLLVLKCTSRSVYPLKGDNRCNRCNRRNSLEQITVVICSRLLFPSFLNINHTQANREFCYLLSWGGWRFLRNTPTFVEVILCLRFYGNSILQLLLYYHHSKTQFLWKWGICLTVFEKSSKVSSAFFKNKRWALECPWWSVPHKKLAARARDTVTRWLNFLKSLTKSLLYHL